MLRAGLIGVAGAAGALARYWFGLAVGVRSFPWATLWLNVIGSFVLGVVVGGPGAERWSATTTSAITVGFLASFTTFSTFAYETTTYLRTDRPGLALAYVAASLVLGLAAAALGYVVGRRLA